MKNIEIRLAIKKSRICNYEIAEHLGVTEYTFSRWLRHEFDEPRRAAALRAISELSGGTE